MQTALGVTRLSESSSNQFAGSCPRRWLIHQTIEPNKPSNAKRQPPNLVILVPVDHLVAQRRHLQRTPQILLIGLEGRVGRSFLLQVHRWNREP